MYIYINHKNIQVLGLFIGAPVKYAKHLTMLTMKLLWFDYCRAGLPQHEAVSLRAPILVLRLMKSLEFESRMLKTAPCLLLLGL